MTKKMGWEVSIEDTVEWLGDGIVVVVVSFRPRANDPKKYLLIHNVVIPAGSMFYVQYLFSPIQRVGNSSIHFRLEFISNI